MEQRQLQAHKRNHQASKNTWYNMKTMIYNAVFPTLKTWKGKNLNGIHYLRKYKDKIALSNGHTIVNASFFMRHDNNLEHKLVSEDSYKNGKTDQTYVKNDRLQWL